MKKKIPLLTLLAAFTAASANAQNADPFGNAPTARKPKQVKTDAAPMNAEFHGEELGDIVDYLRETYAPLNFIVSDSVRQVPINLRVTNVTFDELSLAIEIATEGQVRFDAVNERLIHIRPGESIARRTEPVMRVFNLGRLLSEKKESEAAEAMVELQEVVDQAWDLLQKARRESGLISSSRQPLKTQSRFHPGTKLLIIVGSPEYVQTYEEVVSQLQGGSHRMTTASNRSFWNLGAGGAGGGSGDAYGGMMGGMGSGFGGGGGHESMSGGGGMGAGGYSQAPAGFPRSGVPIGRSPSARPKSAFSGSESSGGAVPAVPSPKAAPSKRKPKSDDPFADPSNRR